MKTLRVLLCTLFLFSCPLPAVASEQLSEKDMKSKMKLWMIKGQEAVKSRLRDPDSAKWGQISFSWGVGGVPTVCGQVNSKNGFGGYTGMQEFITVGRSDFTFFATDVDDFAGLWETMCTDKHNAAAVEKWGVAANIAPITETLLYSR